MTSQQTLSYLVAWAARGALKAVAEANIDRIRWEEREKIAALNGWVKIVLEEMTLELPAAVADFSVAERAVLREAVEGAVRELVAIVISKRG